MKTLREVRRSLLGAAAALAAILACTGPPGSPSAPSEPPPPTEPPPQQTSTSTGQGQASSEANEQAQQSSEPAPTAGSGREASESAQSESGAADEAQPASSESDESPGSERSAEEAAAQQDAAAAGEQSGSGDSEPGSEGQRQAGVSGSSVDRDVLGSAGRERDTGEVAGGSNREPGDLGEAAGGAVGGIPIDEVPPELLEAFGRGGSGTQTESMNGEELARALERLAEHQGQVDELIQQEQTDAALGSGDIGEDSTGIGATAPPRSAGGDGRRAEIIGEADRSSVATTSTDDAAAVGTGYRPPADVGDGRDDDKLAAQLRELAMKETDPALRERYWEEYRKHKGLE